jgi:hypothetical protein
MSLYSKPQKGVDKVRSFELQPADRLNLYSHSNPSMSQYGADLGEPLFHQGIPRLEFSKSSQALIFISFLHSDWIHDRGGPRDRRFSCRTRDTAGSPSGGAVWCQISCTCLDHAAEAARRKIRRGVCQFAWRGIANADCLSAFGRSVAPHVTTRS